MIPVTLARGGAIGYTSVEINFSETKEAKGSFIIDGGLLIWSRDEPVGEFENATVFTKIQ